VVSGDEPTFRLEQRKNAFPRCECSFAAGNATHIDESGLGGRWNRSGQCAF
jgi:hypothetical protein